MMDLLARILSLFMMLLGLLGIGAAFETYTQLSQNGHGGAIVFGGMMSVCSSGMIFLGIFYFFDPKQKALGRLLNR